MVVSTAAKKDYGLADYWDFVQQAVLSVFGKVEMSAYEMAAMLVVLGSVAL